MRVAIASLVLFGIAASPALAQTTSVPTPGNEVHCQVTDVYNHGFRCKAEDKSWDFHTAKRHLDNVSVGEKVRVVSHTSRGVSEVDTAEVEN